MIPYIPSVQDLPDGILKSFRTFSKWFFKILNLQFLLSTTGYSKEQLTTLTRLDLQNSQLETIDGKVFETCSNLTALSLRDNRLALIDSNTFNQLLKLTDLDLANNQIETIDVQLFERCSYLTGLDLSSNKLTRIDGNTFKILNQLTKVDLSCNKLEAIDEKLFEACLKLEEIYLHDNQIKDVKRKTFEYELKSIKIISIYENQINCLSFYDDGKITVSHLFKDNKYGYFSDFKEFLNQFGKV